MESERPDRLYWNVRVAAAAVLRLVDGRSLVLLRSALEDYRWNLKPAASELRRQSEDIRDACARLWDRLLEMHRHDTALWPNPLDILGKVEWDFGPRPDPDTMILPPPP